MYYKRTRHPSTINWCFRTKAIGYLSEVIKSCLNKRITQCKLTSVLMAMMFIQSIIGESQSEYYCF